MDRREFLVGGLQAGIALTALNKIDLAEKKEKFDYDRSKKYYVWTGLNKKATADELKARYTSLKSHGITGVFLGGGIDDREFDAVKEAGLELHSWMWTTNRGDKWIMDNHPDWYMVSRTGKSCFDHPPYVDYYRWVSPLIPGVQDYLKDKVDELASHKAVDGVLLDYVRYPDVILPRALWAKYGLDQTTELPDYDFDYGKHARDAFKAETGRDPMEIKDPANDQEWLHFRYDSVTLLVIQLAEVAWKRKKKITAAVFPTPRLARYICRQDWGNWPLDGVCPMLYSSFYEEKVEWIGDRMTENIQATLLPVYAGLYMPDLGKVTDFTKALSTAMDHGASGVSLFGGVDEDHWKAFEAYLAR